MFYRQNILIKIQELDSLQRSTRFKSLRNILKLYIHKFSFRFIMKMFNACLRPSGYWLVLTTTNYLWRWKTFNLLNRSGNILNSVWWSLATNRDMPSVMAIYSACCFKSTSEQKRSEWWTLIHATTSEKLSTIIYNIKP